MDKVIVSANGAYHHHGHVNGVKTIFISDDFDLTPESDGFSITIFDPSTVSPTSLPTESPTSFPTESPTFWDVIDQLTLPPHYVPARHGKSQLDRLFSLTDWKTELRRALQSSSVVEKESNNFMIYISPLTFSVPYCKFPLIVYIYILIRTIVYVYIFKLIFFIFSTRFHV